MLVLLSHRVRQVEVMIVVVVVMMVVTEVQLIVVTLVAVDGNASRGQLVEQLVESVRTEQHVALASHSGNQLEQVYLGRHLLLLLVHLICTGR